MLLKNHDVLKKMSNFILQNLHKMNTKLLIVLLFAGIFSVKANAFSNPDSSLNLLDKGIIAEKMFEAKGKFNTGDYRGAISIYREVIDQNSKHILAHYYSGEAHLAIKHYDLALEYAEKTKGLITDKPLKELDLLFGKIYQKLGKHDEAIASLEKYRVGLTEKQISDEEIDLMISQCKKAKEVMDAAQPNIAVTKMGPEINSPTDDFGLVPSPDGKTLYFTSRRSDTQGSSVDILGDFKFFTDIYVCTWDSVNGKWNEADNDLAGKLNTEYHESVNYISPDGNMMLVYRNIIDATKSGDIYFSKRSIKTGKWSEPKSFDKKTINTTFWESSACLTGDGNTIFFLSERLGGEGESDIYTSSKVGGKWTQPVSVGSNVNTRYDENTVYVTPDGRWMFFSSRGHNSMGGYDIFRSENQAGVWSAPVNLGAPINTVDDDLHFVLTADKKRAYMSTIAEHGKNERDIYVIDLSNVDILTLGK
jgi:tetratricopeptide (TPR) repeat protein